MFYLIYGNQTATIKKRLNKIVKERLNEADEMNFISFDMKEMDFFDVVDECSFLPLGYERKIVVLRNCLFLEKKKQKDNEKSTINDQGYKKFYNLFSHPNNFCDLVLILDNDSIDMNNEIVKIISNEGKTIPIIDPKKEDINDYIFRYFNDHLKVKIDKDAALELASRINGDLSALVNEANKLSLYTDHITFKDVDTLVHKPLEDKGFLLFNSLISNDFVGTENIYSDLINGGTEVVTLISMLANQFRLLFQIILLSKQGKDNACIANELSLKEIRVKILKKSGFQFSINKIKDILNELYDMDFKIKSGQVDRFYVFEMFLINFNK